MAPRRLTADLFVELMGAGAAFLEQRKETVNSLNVFPVPDGDTGTNMALTLASARRELGTAAGLPLGQAAQRMARGALLGARGNSGVILSQFLRGFAQGMAGLESAGPADLAGAFAAATETAYRAVIKPVEGTMLTVGRGASQAAERAAQEGKDLEGVLQAAVAGAKEALERTPSLLPVLARAGVVDAGGQGLVYFLEGILAAVRGEAAAPEMPSGATTSAARILEAAAEAAGVHAHGPITHEFVEHRYCTEFLIRGQNLDLDEIQALLAPLGDSLLVVGDSELVKVHVHTNHPGRALEVGTARGELLEVSVANMQEQNRIAAAHGQPQDVPVAPSQPPEVAAGNGVVKGIGVVAVAQGEGWRKLLESLGVDQVVPGGQTMNPSAAELVAAIEAVAAPEVVVLPNNSNIVFTARQAVELTERRVHVVPTRTAAAGVAAMMAYTPEGDAAAVAKTMSEAAERVRTAEVTYAVRDSEAWDVAVRAGDCIALVGGSVRAVAQDPESAAMAALRELVSDDDSLISIYYGEDVEPSAAEALAEEARRAWPDCDVEVYAGGQPVYYYVLSVE